MSGFRLVKLLLMVFQLPVPLNKNSKLSAPKLETMLAPSIKTMNIRTSDIAVGLQNKPNDGENCYFKVRYGRRSVLSVETYNRYVNVDSLNNK